MPCFLGWTKANGLLSNILNIEEMFGLYKKHFEGTTRLSDMEKQHLYRFLHEMIGCINLDWKDSCLTGSQYSEVVTQSDETMGFFVLKYYQSVPSEMSGESSARKQRLSGRHLIQAMY